MRLVPHSWNTHDSHSHISSDKTFTWSNSSESLLKLSDNWSEEDLMSFSKEWSSVKSLNVPKKWFRNNRSKHWQKDNWNESGHGHVETTNLWMAIWSLATLPPSSTSSLYNSYPPHKILISSLSHVLYPVQHESLPQNIHSAIHSSQGVCYWYSPQQKSCRLKELLQKVLE